MKIAKFQYHPVAVAIEWWGECYTFYRQNTNEFGGYEAGDTLVQTIQGIFHTDASSFTIVTTTEDSAVQSKTNSYLYCLAKDINGIQQGDMVRVKDRLYLVNGITYMDIIADISLEEVKIHGQE